VDRDDGERGLVLRFQNISDDQRVALVDTLDSLPSLDLPEDEEGEILISEMLEHTRS
jgi:hypothetical protein